MAYKFNPFTGNFDQDSGLTSIPDPLTINNLIVNELAKINHIHGNIAGSVYLHVKNTDDAVLPKGTPVYVKGSVGNTTTLEIGAADSSNSAKMPAIGIIDSALAKNVSGHAAMFGEIIDISTDIYTIGEELFVASGGGLTHHRPVSGYVQSIAIVGRVQQNTGTLLVHSTGAVLDEISLSPLLLMGA